MHKTLLALTILISQLIWLNHLYHEHDVGDDCAICLIAHAQDHAIVPSLPSLSIKPVPCNLLLEVVRSVIPGTAQYCLIRAPPSYS